MENIQETITISSPLDGRILPLESVKDEVFSSKVMGDGVAFIPKSGKLVSPIDGVIDTLADTGHAVGISGDNGIDLLMHIGQDTVGLNGKGFTVEVKEGQRVSKGDVLIRFSRFTIWAAKLDPATPMTIVNTSEFASVEVIADGKVRIGEPVLKITKK